AGLWPVESTPDTIGMVLLNHGLFTFGDTTRQAYRRHVELISRAEEWLDENAPRSSAPADELAQIPPVELARLRREISEAAGRPMVGTRHSASAVPRFVARDALASLASRRPIAPVHIIRTKRDPMVGTDVASFVDHYRRYFEAHRGRSSQELTMLD